MVALLSLLVFATLIVGERAWSWLAGIFALAAFIALQIVVFRHGGWRVLGPHFYYDVVRLARRGRSTLLRCAYILALLAGLALVFERAPAQASWRPNDFAAVSERFAFTLFFIQNLAVMILTPVYLASAITEEKERRTLELLFTTQLSDTEIILGKLFSRIIHLFGFVIAGFPILSLIQFWGGIDMLLIAGNLVNTLLNILTTGSICLLVSAMSRTVSGAVMASYALIGTLDGFPFVLQDARQGGERGVLVQDLGALAVMHFIVTAICLALAVAAVREQETADFGPMAETKRIPDLSGKKPEAARMPKPRVSPDILSVPCTLPPVSDNALLWKERFLGAPPWMLSSVGIVFFALGFPVLTFCCVWGASQEGPQSRRTLEVWAVVLRLYYYVFLACYVLGVAYRATGSIVRERQQQTLEPILLLPIDRSEILRAKWLGSLMRGWLLLSVIFPNIALGTLIGVYHPFSAVLLCLAPWPMIFFFASLGLFLSVVMTTVLRANLVMVLVIALFLGCTFASVDPMAYLETFAFSNWRNRGQERILYEVRIIYALAIMGLFFAGAAVLWILAVTQFENRARS
jgi:ABC-type transport system involved in multi-copper enzyme maturation permease subunit